jgi:hypothetical protein
MCTNFFKFSLLLLIIIFVVLVLFQIQKLKKESFNSQNDFPEINIPINLSLQTMSNNLSVPSSGNENNSTDNGTQSSMTQSSMPKPSMSNLSMPNLDAGHQPIVSMPMPNFTVSVPPNQSSLAPSMHPSMLPSMPPSMLPSMPPNMLPSMPPSQSSLTTSMHPSMPPKDFEKSTDFTPTKHPIVVSHKLASEIPFLIDFIELISHSPRVPGIKPYYISSTSYFVLKFDSKHYFAIIILKPEDKKIKYITSISYNLHVRFHANSKTTKVGFQIRNNTIMKDAISHSYKNNSFHKFYYMFPTPIPLNTKFTDSNSIHSFQFKIFNKDAAEIYVNNLKIYGY